MAKISTYDNVVDPKLEDKLIGTSVGPGEDEEFDDVTYNFTLSQLLDLFTPEIESGITLQKVVEVGNTIVMPTTVAKGIDITLANLSTVYQTGTMITIPAQTGHPYPTYDPAPDAFLARINGQEPGTLIGFVGGFVSEATGADNVGFFAGSDTGAQDSIGFFSRSTDAHTGPHFLATKIISGNSTDVFRVENNGDVKANTLSIYDYPNGEYSKISINDSYFTVSRSQGAFTPMLSTEDGADLTLTNSSGAAAQILNNLTVSRAYTLPNASGTFALITDIPATPTLQQVSDAGKVVSYPDGVSGMVINIDTAVGNTYSGLTINATRGANGLTVSGLVAINAIATDVGIQAISNSIGIAAYAEQGIFAQGYFNGITAQSDGIAGIFNNSPISTENIVEFKKNSVSQAYVTGDGTIVGNKLLINTTVDNGVDKLQVTGSIFSTLDAKINGLTVGKGGGNISSNTAVGLGSLINNITGVSNAAFGASALVNSVVGGNNIAVGREAGAVAGNRLTPITNINSSIFIGSRTSPLLNSQTNQIVIGHDAIGIGSNTTVLGNIQTVATAIYGTLLLGTTVGNASAQVQIDSTNKGFLPPRMTTVQINAISGPANGLVVYNITLNTLCFYNGTSWQKVTSTTM